MWRGERGPEGVASGCGGGSVTAKLNNGVSCAARPLQHSPAPTGQAESLCVDGAVTTQVRRGRGAAMCVQGSMWRLTSWFPSLLCVVQKTTTALMRPTTSRIDQNISGAFFCLFVYVFDERCRFQQDEGMQ